MNLQELIQYGDNTVQKYIRELPDLKIGIYNHNSEFRYTEYLKWKHRVINCLKDQDDNMAIKVENLFQVFEKEYSQESFSEIIAQLSISLDKLNKETTSINNEKSIQKNRRATVLIVQDQDSPFHNKIIREYFRRCNVSFIDVCGIGPFIKNNIENEQIYKHIVEENKIDFAIVIYHNNNESIKNMAFAHGFLCALIGEEKVCALNLNKATLPDGLAFISLENDHHWLPKLASFMRIIGLDIE